MLSPVAKFIRGRRVSVVGTCRGRAAPSLCYRFAGNRELLCVSSAIRTQRTELQWQPDVILSVAWVAVVAGAAHDPENDFLRDSTDAVVG